VNGVLNDPSTHAKSAVMLSYLLMCPVIGVYNQSHTVEYKSLIGKAIGVVREGGKCLGDEKQFNGLFSDSAADIVRSGKSMESALARNPAQVTLFQLLRRPEHRRTEVFAHSEGNLILSNVLQAIAAVDGPSAIAGRVVHSFGSPVWTWPPGIIKREYGFTFDWVTWVHFMPSLSISKIGRPSGYLNPFTHGFEHYLHNDPEFQTNRFRFGSAWITLNMDEEGLADALVAMGTNIYRVCDVMHHLANHCFTDSDDVALLYVERIQKRPDIYRALAHHRELVELLIQVMAEGWTSAREQRAIDWLKTL